MACGYCSRIQDAYYVQKLHAGLTTDSERRYHATPPDRPELQVVLEDGWVALTGSKDPITQLLEADYRRRPLEAHADLGFLR